VDANEIALRKKVGVANDRTRDLYVVVGRKLANEVRRPMSLRAEMRRHLNFHVARDFVEYLGDDLLEQVGLGAGVRIEPVEVEAGDAPQQLDALFRGPFGGQALQLLEQLRVRHGRPRPQASPAPRRVAGRALANVGAACARPASDTSAQAPAPDLGDSRLSGQSAARLPCGARRGRKRHAPRPPR
jgi:hypothetical protein